MKIRNFIQDTLDGKPMNILTFYIIVIKCLNMTYAQ